MAAGQDAQAAGERVEALLAELRSHAGPQVAATAEELVRCLVELYGAGLAQIVAILGADEGDGSGPQKPGQAGSGSAGGEPAAGP